MSSVFGSSAAARGGAVAADTTTGLKSFWKFDEGSGSAFVDSTSAHDGTLTSSSLWGTSEIIFNGSDYGHVADHADFNLGATGTVFCWIKGAAQDGKAILGQFDFGAGQRSWTMTSSNAGSFNTLRIACSDDGTSSAGHIKDYLGSQVCLDNTNHSIAFRFNAGTLDLFVDGVKDASVTKTSDDPIVALHNSTAELSFGNILNSGSGSAIPYTGAMRKVRLYNTAKADADIAAIHALGV